jgi:hypothetical protein
MQANANLRNHLIEVYQDNLRNKTKINNLRGVDPYAFVQLEKPDKSIGRQIKQNFSKIVSNLEARIITKDCISLMSDIKSDIVEKGYNLDGGDIETFLRYCSHIDDLLDSDALQQSLTSKEKSIYNFISDTNSDIVELLKAIEKLVYRDIDYRKFAFEGIAKNELKRKLNPLNIDQKKEARDYQLQEDLRFDEAFQKRLRFKDHILKKEKKDRAEEDLINSALQVSRAAARNDAEIENQKYLEDVIPIFEEKLHQLNELDVSIKLGEKIDEIKNRVDYLNRKIQKKTVQMEDDTLNARVIATLQDEIDEMQLEIDQRLQDAGMTQAELDAFNRKEYQADVKHHDQLQREVMFLEENIRKRTDKLHYGSLQNRQKGFKILKETISQLEIDIKGDKAILKDHQLGDGTAEEVIDRMRKDKKGNILRSFGAQVEFIKRRIDRNSEKLKELKKLKTKNTLKKIKSGFVGVPYMPYEPEHKDDYEEDMGHPVTGPVDSVVLPNGDVFLPPPPPQPPADELPTTRSPKTKKSTTREEFDAPKKKPKAREEEEEAKAEPVKTRSKSKKEKSDTEKVFRLEDGETFTIKKETISRVRALDVGSLKKSELKSTFEKLGIKGDAEKWAYSIGLRKAYSGASSKQRRYISDFSKDNYEDFINYITE